MKISIGVVFLCLSVVCFTALSFAQDDPFSEDDLFSDEETVIAVEEKQDEQIPDIANQESVAFSGDISANFGYTFLRDYFDGDADFEDNPYTTSMEGDFLLDVRLKKGIKAFGDLWVGYFPQNEPGNPDTDHLQNTLKELFVDVNIKQKVYFRFGKQNLKWGQGYLWNPTDVISEDRKDFSDIEARREGVYGLKMHIPFGTTWNIYSFVNMSGADKSDQFSVAGKIEVLLFNDIEMSVSAWKKKDYVAVYGIDFATYKFRANWRGELSLSHGDNRRRFELQNGEYVAQEVTDWTPRLCLGFTRMFDFRDINDRISLTGEFYYNHGGYDDNMLKDEMSRGAFLGGGYFEPNNYGKYYAAIFTSYRKFLVSDMTLNLNAISNLSDSSVILMSGIAYELANNAWLNVDLSGYLGSKNTEYTLEGNALKAELSVSLSF